MMDRLEFIRKVLDDKFHRKCYYCEHGVLIGLISDKVRCKIFNKEFHFDHVCENWKLDENLVKAIAFKTSLYEEKNSNPSGKEKIRVAVVGVGNCCSALVQGVFCQNEDYIVLSHLNVGGYEVGDIEFVAAFDIDERKVGKDLSEAIFSEPNNFRKVLDVPYLNVPVLMGHVFDSVEGMLKNVIKVSREKPVDVAKTLAEKKVEVVVNFLPTGVEEASKFYAEEALKAGCAFINATPTPIATDKNFAEKFEETGVPLIGDDVMSQVGGTILHKNLLEFLGLRGVKITNSYQVDVGGGMESYNTLEPSKRSLKRKIKTGIIRSALPYEAEIVAGTTDYVDFMENARTSYFWISGKYFLGTPVTIDLYLKTVDAPNSTPIILDSIRAAKLALNRKVGGPLISVCAYGYKQPPVKTSIYEAEKWFIEFVEGKREK